MLLDSHKSSSNLHDATHGGTAKHARAATSAVATASSSRASADLRAASFHTRSRSTSASTNKRAGLSRSVTEVGLDANTRDAASIKTVREKTSWITRGRLRLQDGAELFLEK